MSSFLCQTVPYWKRSQGYLPPVVSSTPFRFSFVRILTALSARSSLCVAVSNRPELTHSSTGVTDQLGVQGSSPWTSFKLLIWPCWTSWRTLSKWRSTWHHVFIQNSNAICKILSSPSTYTGVRLDRISQRTYFQNTSCSEQHKVAGPLRNELPPRS